MISISGLVRTEVSGNISWLTDSNLDTEILIKKKTTYLVGVGDIYILSISHVYESHVLETRDFLYEYFLSE